MHPTLRIFVRTRNRGIDVSAGAAWALPRWEVAAMPSGYGVLRAGLDRWVREDDRSTPHLQIRALDQTGQPWRIAVNVQSDTGSEVVYWLVDPLLDHPVLAGLAALPTGFSAAARTPAAALDY